MSVRAACKVVLKAEARPLPVDEELQLECLLVLDADFISGFVTLSLLNLNSENVMSCLAEHNAHIKA